LIHPEGFSLLDSFENYPLIGCVHHANTHQDGQSVMNLPPVETYISSMFSHQPSWNCQVIQTWISYLAVKGSSLYAQCSFSISSSQLVKSDYEKRCIEDQCSWVHAPPPETPKYRGSVTVSPLLPLTGSEDQCYLQIKQKNTQGRRF
jgi:hypothetical protein